MRKRKFSVLFLSLLLIYLLVVGVSFSLFIINKNSFSKFNSSTIIPTPTSQQTLSASGIFLKFIITSNGREIVIKDNNGTEYGFPLAANIKYIVSPPNLKVKESYLQPGDRLYIETIQPQGGYQTAVSIVDYTEHKDLKSRLIMDDVVSGVSLSELSWTNLSDTTSWKTYNKNFDGVHLYFKYPKNMHFSDDDSSSPISFFYVDSSNQRQYVFQIERYWAEEVLDSKNFLVWYRTNIPLNYDETLSEIQTIYLPKNTIYKIRLKRSKNSYIITYVVSAGKATLILSKSDSMSEQDLLSVLNTLSAYCLSQCLQ